MRTPQKAVDLIKHFEGLRLKAYRCSANVLTIGYGHTSGVTDGMEITEAEAEALLLEDLARFESGVDRLCGNLPKNQFGALVSFAFNLGLGALQRSTLRQKILRGDHEGAEAEFLKWVRAGGRILPGLVRRRAAESALFSV